MFFRNRLPDIEKVMNLEGEGNIRGAQEGEEKWKWYKYIMYEFLKTYLNTNEMTREKERQRDKETGRQPSLAFRTI